MLTKDATILLLDLISDAKSDLRELLEDHLERSEHHDSEYFELLNDRLADLVEVESILNENI